MFLTGPAVVKAVMHEDCSAEELGGVEMHANLSGLVDKLFDTSDEIFSFARDFVRHLPATGYETVGRNLLRSVGVGGYDLHSVDQFEDSLDDWHPVVPDDAAKPYDVLEFLRTIADKESFFVELRESYAGSVVTAFGTFGGILVGIVANQPIRNAGALCAESSRKAAEFINFCSNFSIPILMVVDLPGFLPGVEQERAGVIDAGASLLRAYASSRSVKVTLITRKAYGGGFIAMGSKPLGADLVIAWQTAQIAVMGAEGAAAVALRKNLADLDFVEKYRNAVESYRKKYMNLEQAARFGYVDLVIAPHETVRYLRWAFSVLVGSSRRGVEGRRSSLF